MGLLLWLFKGDFKVGSGTVYWCRITYGRDFDSSEIASAVKRHDDKHKDFSRGQNMCLGREGETYIYIYTYIHFMPPM